MTKQEIGLGLKIRIMWCFLHIPNQFYLYWLPSWSFIEFLNWKSGLTYAPSPPSHAKLNKDTPYFHIGIFEINRSWNQKLCKSHQLLKPDQI